MHTTADSQVRHPYLAGPYPHAVAHRGGAESADVDVWAENTLSAFRAAYRCGFRLMETDVHLTRDGVVVAFHDDVIDRVTDASGRIGDWDWSELSQVTVAGCERIPTMAELLSSLHDVRFNIDPKADDVVEALGDVLVESDAFDRVCIGAFSDERIARMRERFGDRLCVGAGPNKVVEWLGAVAGDGPMPTQVDLFQVPPSFGETAIVTSESVDMAHAHGVAVHVWTIDDPAEMHRLLDLGVDGIMTDRPSVLRSVLEARGVWHEGDRRR